MRHAALTFFAAALVAVGSLAAGCATRQSMDSDYEQALAQWQGATEELLVSRWGKPQSEEQIGSGRWLTFVVNNPGVRSNGPTIGIGIGGFGIGGGGRSSVGVGIGATAPLNSGSAGTPVTCTTRFLVENGKVSSWTFEGAGCGAPG